VWRSWALALFSRVVRMRIQPHPRRRAIIPSLPHLFHRLHEMQPAVRLHGATPWIFRDPANQTGLVLQGVVSGTAKKKTAHSESSPHPRARPQMTRMKDQPWQAVLKSFCPAKYSRLLFPDAG
jgi:hypothetical protein